jgi:calmodulin
MRKLGQNPSEADLIEMISTVDDNGDNEIDFPEFLILMKSRIGEKDPEKELRDAFRVFDTDNSGSIDKKELKRLMKKLGQALSEAELDAMMDEVDTNGDGQISFEEFKELMVSIRRQYWRFRWRLDLDLCMMMSQTGFAFPLLRAAQNS